jgi:hypothetical protein
LAGVPRRRRRKKTRTVETPLDLLRRRRRLLLLRVARMYARLPHIDLKKDRRDMLTRVGFRTRSPNLRTCTLSRSFA